MIVQTTISWNIHDLDITADVDVSDDDGSVLVTEVALGKNREYITSSGDVFEWAASELENNEAFVDYCHRDTGLEYYGRGANDPDGYFKFSDG